MGLTKKDENLAAYQIAAEVHGPSRYPRRYDLPNYHQARRNTKELSRSIWRHCSMMCCTVSDMLMEEKILLRERRCGWDFMM
ncbi:MAG: hypothetical protein ACLU6Y_18415 [Ruminococcus sp.]